MKPEMQIAKDALRSRPREHLIRIEIFRNDVPLIEVLDEPVFEHYLVMLLPICSVEIALPGPFERAKNVQHFI